MEQLAQHMKDIDVDGFLIAVEIYNFAKTSSLSDDLLAREYDIESIDEVCKNYTALESTIHAMNRQLGNIRSEPMKVALRTCITSSEDMRSKAWGTIEKGRSCKSRHSSEVDGGDNR